MLNSAKDTSIIYKKLLNTESAGYFDTQLLSCEDNPLDFIKELKLDPLKLVKELKLDTFIKDVKDLNKLDVDEHVPPDANSCCSTGTSLKRGFNIVYYSLS
jgi:hypothetical protein